MARTLDLIRGYMFSHRMELRGAGDIRINNFDGGNKAEISATSLIEQSVTDLPIGANLSHLASMRRRFGETLNNQPDK